MLRKLSSDGNAWPFGKRPFATDLPLRRGKVSVQVDGLDKEEPFWSLLERLDAEARELWSSFPLELPPNSLARPEADETILKTSEEGSFPFWWTGWPSLSLPECCFSGSMAPHGSSTSLDSEMPVSTPVSK